MRELSDEELIRQARAGMDHASRGGDWKAWIASKEFTPEDSAQIEALAGAVQ